MNMRGCLADVARGELKALMQDAKAAIHGLERQRGSVFQALEAAQMSDESLSECPDETDLRIMGLLDSVHRLDGVSNEVMREIEQIEVTQFSPETSRPIPWPIIYRLVLSENHHGG
jgi:hypothetical protein